jgi:hypothetical protein
MAYKKLVIHGIDPAEAEDMADDIAATFELVVDIEDDAK